MSYCSHRAGLAHCVSRSPKMCVSWLALVCASTPVLAAQLDIVAPPDSGRFGYQVLALPNGNVVVSDPFNQDWSRRAGAVYLYSANGTLISTLNGSEAGDGVGEQLWSLGNGNFVVISPNWNHNRGAVTLVNGSTGLSGTVSADNSLVGTQVNDHVGYSYIESWFEPPPPPRNFAVVGDHNYVVISNHWSDGSKSSVGAVTWCNGVSGCTGPVTSANSLIGGTAGDFIGTSGFEVLVNGNYLVLSDAWDNPGVAQNVGAVTLGNGNGGTTGVVTAANSLVGSHPYDFLGITVAPLSNGNYVLGISTWSNETAPNAGAAVWGSGTSGVVGTISAANAMIGTQAQDYVGSRVTALSNGHYVVCSRYLDVGSLTDAGAAIWGNGESGTTGIASALPSLTGPGGGTGPFDAVALTNGHYVVLSPDWDAGGAPKLGAATWVNGSAATSATVSAANSLVGSSANDSVGNYGAVALSNGNYVVRSPQWDGVAEDTGAATWANGSTGLVGTVSASNSLVGTTPFEGASSTVIALTNGNYVVANPSFDNGSATNVGAVTWGNGASGIVGAVSVANSLVGASPNDSVGSYGMVALSNGHYVVNSYSADLGGFADTGAVTWGNGNTGLVGTLSTNNSLYGRTNYERIGDGGITAQPDGNYVVRTNSSVLGAFTLARGNAPFEGSISAANTVFSTSPPHNWMASDYDPIHHRLVVGRQSSNLVSVLTLDADALFADGFEGP